MATYQYNAKISVDVTELDLTDAEKNDLAARFIDDMTPGELCRAFDNDEDLMGYLLQNMRLRDVLDQLDDNAGIRDYVFTDLSLDEIVEEVDERELCRTLVQRRGIDEYISAIPDHDKSELAQAVLGTMTNEEIIHEREDDTGLFYVLVNRMTWSELMSQIDDKASMVETCFNELGADALLEAIDDDEAMAKAILRRSERRECRLEDASQWILEQALARKFDAMTIQKDEREAALTVGGAMLQGSLEYVAVTALKMVRNARYQATELVLKAAEDKRVLDDALAAVDRMNAERDAALREQQTS